MIEFPTCSRVLRSGIIGQQATGVGTHFATFPCPDMIFLPRFIPIGYITFLLFFFMLQTLTPPPPELPSTPPETLGIETVGGGGCYCVEIRRPAPPREGRASRDLWRREGAKLTSAHVSHKEAAFTKPAGTGAALIIAHRRLSPPISPPRFVSAALIKVVGSMVLLGGDWLRGIGRSLIWCAALSV